MSFIHDDFLLTSAASKSLYHDFAEKMPIVDFHSHLSAREVADDRVFGNLFEIWLEGDHYKWRAMRANGVPEELITGDAPPKEKFLAWARTVPRTLRNPLFHWTALELKRYFGIDEILCDESAERIWCQANEKLTRLSAQKILEEFNVEVLCTTDSPTDDLSFHRYLAEHHKPFGIFPTFRPDSLMQFRNDEATREEFLRLGQVTNIPIEDTDSFFAALAKRHEDFFLLGAKASDHGLSKVPIFGAEASGGGDPVKGFLNDERGSHFTGALLASGILREVGRLDHSRDMAMQLHVGAARNNRSLARPDSGFDSIGDDRHGRALNYFLKSLDAKSSLPKTILYNNNPSDDYVFATAAANFNGDSPGKIQYGPAWWHMDTKDGIRRQIDTLSNTGLLAHAVGMTTDSRSFMSFPRHEYYRRILCDLLGSEMERGELPGDLQLIGGMVEDVCYHNAIRYFGFCQTPSSSESP